MSAWSDVIEGTATGPMHVIEVPEGCVTVQALWSDVEGVGVSVDISPDMMLRPQALLTIGRAVESLMLLDPPVLARA